MVGFTKVRDNKRGATELWLESRDVNPELLPGGLLLGDNGRSFADAEKSQGIDKGGGWPKRKKLLLL